MNNNLANNLKKIRKDNNLSQEQLAEELGVSRQAISKWESGISYPEMDKILQLCKKFDLDIDSLLNKDIREAKGEEISKKNIKNTIDSFLKYVTDSVNMFARMTLGSKIKCIIEEFFIIVILFLIAIIFNGILQTSLISILNYLPDSAAEIILGIIKLIYNLLVTIIIVVITTYIFKERYLNYYRKTNKEEKPQEKEIISEKEKQIIIRDLKDSEYNFISPLFKIIILGIKFITLLIIFISCIILVISLVFLVLSFLLFKTGIFFLGLLLSSLSASIIIATIILMLINFIFDRKNEKKKIVYTILISIIVFGIGIGFIISGALKFDYVYKTKDNDLLVTRTMKLNMQENMYITQNTNNIEYIEKETDDILVEYKINNLLELTYYYSEPDGIYFYSYFPSTRKAMLKVIENLNNKRVINIDRNIYDVKIYTSRKNIEKLKANYNKHYY